MPSKEQIEVQPLASTNANYNINLDRDDGLPPELIRHRRHRKYVMCCGCITALILILVVVLVVLMFTVFRAKSPILTINSIRVEGLDRVNWSDIRPNTNLTILADVAVKNPNVASLKFNNATTVLLYDGNFIGLAESPEALAEAGRTVRFNVTMEAMVAQFLNVSRLQSDYLAGILPVSSYTRISGKVKIWNIITRSIVVRTNCTMTVNVTSYSILQRSCRRKVNM